MKRAVLLLVDGLRPDVAEAALNRGELPHLGAMVREGSLGRGVTVFPSTTSVAYLPFLTGCTPGRCNVPSIRWLDREAYTGRWWEDREAVRSYCGYQAGRLDADIAPGIRTIFELIPESLGIFTPVAKGLTPERDPSRAERQFWGALAHYALWHQPSDDAVRRHLLSGIDAGWRFIFAQFPAVDGYTHQSTPEGPKVLRALREVDTTVGLVRARLEGRGELDDTLILMVSDHGSTVVHTHLDLADWFRGQGVKTLSHPVLWERDPLAAVMVAGNGSAMVYARPNERRRERWPMARLRDGQTFGVSHDVVAALVSEPAVAFAGGQVDGRTGGLSVSCATGEAELRRDGHRIVYRRLTGDPLEIGADRSLDEQEWLDATWDAPYPDACVQLLDQFRAPRTGDLVVVAHEGYDFRRRYEIPEHKAGHGSLFKAHMQVPVWSNVPGAPTPLRTVDLFPAMMEWLGEAAPERIDGRAVWSPGRAAVEA
jgi:diadenosine tetraphosphatase ApaH/serine/threonine PP2A family protein phosphatase